jgi:hypothetical protein
MEDCGPILMEEEVQCLDLCRHRIQVLKIFVESAEISMKEERGNVERHIEQSMEPARTCFQGNLGGLDG